MSWVRFPSPAPGFTRFPQVPSHGSCHREGSGLRRPGQGMDFHLVFTGNRHQGRAYIPFAAQDCQAASMNTPSFSRSKLLRRYPELADAHKASLSIEWCSQGFMFEVRGLDPANPGMPAVAAGPLPAIPRDLPFADASFDHVVFIAGLERQPGDQRRHVISEMLRLSRKSVFLSSSFAHPGPVRPARRPGCRAPQGRRGATLARRREQA